MRGNNHLGALTILMLITTVDSAFSDTKTITAHSGSNPVFDFDLTSVGKQDSVIGFNDMSILALEKKADNYTERTNVTFYDRHLRLEFMLINITKADAGWYKLTDEQWQQSSQQLLIVLDKPTRPEIEIVTVNGTNVRLKCTSNSTSVPWYHNLTMTYTWRKNGHVFENVSQTVEVDQEKKVIRYSCQTQEQDGLKSDISEELYGPDTPYIVKGSSDDIRNISCHADCHPECDVRLREEALSTDVTGIVVNVTGSHGRIFICSVSNVFGSANTNKTFSSNKTRTQGTTMQEGDMVVGNIPTTASTEAGIIMIAVITSSTAIAILIIITIIGIVVIVRRRKDTEIERRPNVDTKSRITRNNNVCNDYAIVRKIPAPVNGSYYRYNDNPDCETLAQSKMEARANSGETNAEGCTYANLDLCPGSTRDGLPVVFSNEESVHYEDIDFSKTPGPLLPTKCWEMEAANTGASA